MFSYTLHGTTNIPRIMLVNNSVVGDYLRSLRPVNLGEVDLMELLHTMIPYGANADTLDQCVDEVKSAEYYRDAAGNLVVREERVDHDRLTLLWPVARPVVDPTEATVVRGGGDGVFVEASDAGGLVPLPAAAADCCGYGWGRTGTGPVNLYMALVYAVNEEQAPSPGKVMNDPRSLYGWITRQDKQAELRLPWPELVRLVGEDRPLRAAIARAENRPT